MSIYTLHEGLFDRFKKKTPDKSSRDERNRIRYSDKVNRNNIASSNIKQDETNSKYTKEQLQRAEEACIDTITSHYQKIYDIANKAINKSKLAKQCITLFGLTDRGEWEEDDEWKCISNHYSYNYRCSIKSVGLSLFSVDIRKTFPKSTESDITREEIQQVIDKISYLIEGIEKSISVYSKAHNIYIETEISGEWDNFDLFLFINIDNIISAVEESVCIDFDDLVLTEGESILDKLYNKFATLPAVKDPPKDLYSDAERIFKSVNEYYGNLPHQQYLLLSATKLNQNGLYTRSVEKCKQKLHDKNKVILLTLNISYLSKKVSPVQCINDVARILISNGYKINPTTKSNMKKLLGLDKVYFYRYLRNGDILVCEANHTYVSSYGAVEAHSFATLKFKVVKPNDKNLKQMNFIEAVEII